MPNLKLKIEYSFGSLRIELRSETRSLYLSTYLYKDDGKESVEVKFLNNDLVTEDKENQNEGKIKGNWNY